MGAPTGGYDDPVLTIAVLRAAIADDVTRLRESEPILLEGVDPEGIHQARVACRRLRSQLRTFEPVLRSKAVAPLAAGLKWLGTLFGGVRDLDVLAERLEADLADLPPGERDLADSVVKRCRTERQAVFGAATKAVMGPRYARLVEALDGAVAVPPVRRRAAASPAAGVLVPEVRRRWEDIEREVAAMPAGPADPALHHVRILAKRARYAAEVAAPLGPVELGKLAGRLAKVQKVLGELNDAARTVAWLEGVKRQPWPEVPGSAGPGAGGDVMAAVEVALAAEHTALARRRREWRGVFERAAGVACGLGWSSEQAGPSASPSGPQPSAEDRAEVLPISRARP